MTMARLQTSRRGLLVQQQRLIHHLLLLQDRNLHPLRPAPQHRHRQLSLLPPILRHRQPTRQQATPVLPRLWELSQLLPKATTCRSHLLQMLKEPIPQMQPPRRRPTPPSIARLQPNHQQHHLLRLRLFSYPQLSTARLLPLLPSSSTPKPKP
ncbi:hypothetical protein MPH_01843 [Macrophomina phaseolina MS6]|uniref:Uncharacterized protein n=1 Tax=Macrophomina phaseolina (strain MS6) TaxID=1126212 RepID=K2SWA9_MACPH|nr:hypothetical protein MPH_01843 [Macrophomina phaseolina MS6]